MMPNITTTKDHLATIRNIIFSNFPKDAGLNRIEFEGPEIAIYCRNPSAVLTDGETVRKLAKLLKKRIVIRSDPSVRKSQEETVKILSELIPKEAEVKNYTFDEDKGDVIIEALKPRIVIGTGGSTLRAALIQTGWRPVVVRAPEIRSGIVSSMLRVLTNGREYRQRFLREVGEKIHRPLLFSDAPIRVVPLGGFGEVGRSAVLIDTGETKVLLDVGVKAGATKLIDEFPAFYALDFPVEEIDAVVIAHAHMDHQGALPYLFKYGYRGPVYMTAPTRDLMVLTQKDYIELKQKMGEIPPYGIEHITKAVQHTITIDWGEVTDISPDIKLTLANAGHILGSSVVHLNIGDGKYNLLYTSDLKYSNTRLLDKASTSFNKVDCLIIESTYGGKGNIMPNRLQEEEKFVHIIKKTIEQGGKVLIPTLAVGRAQEVMMILAEKISSKELPDVPVFLDGMLLESTAIHTAYPEFLSINLRKRIYQGDNPFLHQAFVRIDDVSKRDEALSNEPCIILATSGMMTGGPVLEYFKELCSSEKNSLIFVNYQAENTLGRTILKGAREVTLSDPLSSSQKTYQIRMSVHVMEGFSGHADHLELIRYALTVKPSQKILINHGEPMRSMELARELRRRFSNMKEKPEALVPANLDALRVL
jgi:arCOG00543 universal archaeal KH-domain/beta-lactamase-domain protein